VPGQHKPDWGGNAARVESDSSTTEKFIGKKFADKKVDCDVDDRLGGHFNLECIAVITHFFSSRADLCLGTGSPSVVTNPVPSP
jgi:hypothetical protein